MSPVFTLLAEEGASHAAEEGLRVFAGPGQWWQISIVTVSMWAIIAVLLLLAYFTGRQVQKVPRGKLQGTFELLFDFLEGWFAGFIGSRHHARKYLPILGSLFIFIIFSNYSGLLPNYYSPNTEHLRWFQAPTSQWGTTLGLSIFVMIACQVVAIREQGFGHYLHGFLGPAPGPMSILMTPLTILEEFVRPFSLSLRLFGNIFAEETLLTIVLGLAGFTVVIPLPIMGLSLLFGAIQALVFSTLTAIYLGSSIHGAH